MFNTSGVTTALPAPEGYVVDFGNPQRRGVLETFVTLSVGMVLVLLFLFQRLYVKIVIRKRFGVDDEAAMDGYVGVHGWEVPIEKFKDFTFYNSYMNPIVYAIPPGACKMVILMFFLEINSSTDWFRRSVYFTMFVVVGSSLGILFSSIFPCNPIQSAYDLATPGTCIDRVATFKATATFGVITDMMIICLPIPMVLNLQVSTRKKIGLLSLFGIGSV
ncbi:integral membrane protein [Colletotrichum higginsianum]|nr:integral membrane protein [Colletotrichum higginsianum]